MSALSNFDALPGSARDGQVDDLAVSQHLDFDYVGRLHLVDAPPNSLEGLGVLLDLGAGDLEDDITADDQLLLADPGRDPAGKRALPGR